MTDLLELAPLTVSKHLSILHQALLVDTRKDGRWVYYRLADEVAPVLVREAIAWVCECLAEDSQAQGGAQRVDQLIEVRPEMLCCIQRNRGTGCCAPAPVSRAVAGATIRPRQRTAAHASVAVRPS